MTRRRAILIGVAVLLVVAAAATTWSVSRMRAARKSIAAQRAEIAALERERDDLRQRLETLIVKDPRLEGMPDTPVRLMVPTSLAGDLVERVIAGAVSQVTIELKNLRVRKQGIVRKVVTLGTWDLRVVVNRVTGLLRPGTPTVTFGGNRVGLVMPVALASGRGEATVSFLWDGRNVGGMVCGDMAITQKVTGTVRPRSYPVSASLTLTSSATEILLEPKLPPVRLTLNVVPSDASWQAAQQVIDDKRGLCGAVLDRVDVLGPVKRLIDKGFTVRLPTERVTPMALPVGVHSTMLVRGEPVALGVRVGGLRISPHAIWLGAYVSVAVGNKS